MAPDYAIDPVSSLLTRRELFALALSVALAPLNSTMLAAALPAIAHDLNKPAASLTSWLVTSYLVIALVMQSPAGKLSDGLGHARTLIVGQVLFGAASILGAVHAVLPQLVVSRVLMALGGALIIPSALAVVRSRVPEGSRTAAFGAFSAAIGIATASGPLIGGELASRVGWSSVFFVNAPIVIVAMLLGLGRGRERAPAKLPPFDIIGAVLLIVGLVLVIVGARSSAYRVPAVAAGSALLVAFSYWERRVAEPLVDFGLFSLRAFLAGTMVIALQNLAVYALIFELPIVLSRARSLDAKEAGRSLLSLTVSMVVFSGIGGKVARRFGERSTALVGTVASLVGVAMLGWSPLGWMTPALVVLGAGSGLATPSAQAAGLNAIPAEKSGMAVGVGTTTRYLGGVLGIAVVTALVDSGDPMTRFRLGTLIFGGALALAILSAAMLPRRASKTA